MANLKWQKKNILRFMLLSRGSKRISNNYICYFEQINCMLCLHIDEVVSVAVRLAVSSDPVVVQTTSFSEKKSV